MNKLIFLLSIIVLFACRQSAPAYENRVSFTDGDRIIPMMLRDSLVYDTFENVAAQTLGKDDQGYTDHGQTPTTKVIQKEKSRAKQMDSAIDSTSSNYHKVHPITDQPTKQVEQDVEMNPKMEVSKKDHSKPISLNPTSQADLHEVFNRLLNKYVTDVGTVDYTSFLTEKNQLKEYLNKLATLEETRLKTHEAKLAYWINLYNAATIHLILSNYPLNKITDLDGGKTWDVKRVKTTRGLLSLNEIENGIIRPEFNDARIHFAVNCAAKSCPPLANFAFVPEKLDQQLHQRTNSFINNNSWNTLTADRISVSKIFEWYEVDFQPSVKAFLSKYSEQQINQGLTIEYLDYDWSLNDAN